MDWLKKLINKGVNIMNKFDKIDKIFDKTRDILELSLFLFSVTMVFLTLIFSIIKMIELFLTIQGFFAIIILCIFVAIMIDFFTER